MGGEINYVSNEQHLHKQRLQWMKSAPSTTSLQTKLGGDKTMKGGRVDKFKGGIVD